MSDLVLVADSAFPFDYSRLPSDVVCQLGYVGQLHETPHVWTADEVAHARQAVGAWAPIWTVPPSGFTVDVGKQAGNGMASALTALNYPHDGPVFLDVEHKTWAENPSRAMDAVAAWTETMAAHRWPNAHAYLPLAAGKGWLAHWTGIRPTSLPAGAVGLQYINALDGDRYDLSVFDRSIFTPLLTTGDNPMANLDAADQKWITDQLIAVQTNVLNHIEGMWYNGWTGHPNEVNLSAINTMVKHLTTVANAPSTGGVDVSALASALGTALGPQLAGAIAVELSKRLAT